MLRKLLGGLRGNHEPPELAYAREAASESKRQTSLVRIATRFTIASAVVTVAVAAFQFFDGDRGPFLERSDEEASPTETTSATLRNDDQLAPGSGLSVQFTWPVPSTTYDGFPMAMLADTTVHEYANELTLTEDPRQTALRLGAVPIGSEWLTMILRNPTDQPAYISSVRFPIAQIIDDERADPQWISCSAKGCGDEFYGRVGDPYLRYDLDEGELIAVLPDGAEAPVGSVAGLDYFGAEISADQPFALSVQVAACESLYSWSVVIDDELDGEVHQLLVPPEGEDSFGLVGATHDTPLYQVIPSQGGPGREVRATEEDTSLRYSLGGGKAC